MRRSPKMLLIVTVLSVAAVTAPLLAGYCLDCGHILCPFPSCSMGTTYTVESYCKTCTGFLGFPFYCTACKWYYHQCYPNPGYASCHPPYARILVDEQNKWDILPLVCRLTAAGVYRCF